MTLSTIILADQDNPLLRQAIKSVDFSDEIIVIWDSISKNTPSKLKNIKLLKHPLKNFAAQRNFALKKAHGDWILFLDSDEQISPRLNHQIQTAISKDNKVNGYYIPRRDIFYGQQLNYGETGNVALLRLARRNIGSWHRPVHEYWKIKGEVKALTALILHHRGDLTTSFIARMIKYSPLDALALIKDKKPFALWRALLYPSAKFFTNYFLKAGFLDGALGLFHAYLMTIQSLTIRIYQWEDKNHNKSYES